LKKKTKQEIDIILIVLFAGLAVLFVLYFGFNFEPFLFFQPDNLTELDISIPDDNFTRFALVVTFLYDAMPTIAQQFSISAIGVQLLMTGFSPVLFALISALGILVGQMVLYVVGMFLKRIHKGSFGDIAGKHHFLHKYHFLVFLMIPFVGIVGDGAMLLSGHQRINPIKMIPFLFIADVASTLRWIIPTLGELQISESLM